MDHSTIIKRAATITRRHRALWLFGFLVALTGGGSGGFGGSSNYSGNGGDFGGAPGAELRWPEGLPGRAFVDQLVQELSQRGQGLHFDPANPGWVLAGLVLICGGLLLLVLLAIGLNYVARAALMRMVDQIEARGESPGIGLGFDWMVAENSGIYFRYRWFSFEDRSFAIDQYQGREITIELKTFF